VPLSTSAIHGLTFQFSDKPAGAFGAHQDLYFCVGSLAREIGPASGARESRALHGVSGQWVHNWSTMLEEHIFLF
jgi:hypothetical protein